MRFSPEAVANIASTFLTLGQPAIAQEVPKPVITEPIPMVMCEGVRESANWDFMTGDNDEQSAQRFLTSARLALEMDRANQKGQDCNTTNGEGFDGTVHSIFATVEEGVINSQSIQLTPRNTGEGGPVTVSFNSLNNLGTVGEKTFDSSYNLNGTTSESNLPSLNTFRFVPLTEGLKALQVCGDSVIPIKPDTKTQIMDCGATKPTIEIQYPDGSLETVNPFNESLRRLEELKVINIQKGLNNGNPVK